MLVTLLGIGDMALDKTDKDLARSLVRKTIHMKTSKNCVKKKLTKNCVKYYIGNKPYNREQWWH